MALSDEKIRELAHDFAPYTDEEFARAVEAEVRKQVEPLIRQMLASLEGYRRNWNDPQQCDAERAARAWLEKNQ